MTLSTVRRLWPGILVLIWLSIQLFWWWRGGVRTGVDSALYIDQAELIMDGQLPADRGIWYLGYSIFLALLFSAGFSLVGVVAVQVLLSAVSVAALYGISTRVMKDERAAVLAALLYCLWPGVHEWNFFIYTESLYTSLSLMSIWALIHADLRWKLIGGVLLLACVATRPTGFCLLSALAAIGLIQLSKSHPAWALAAGGAAILAGIFLFNAFMQEADLPARYLAAEVIYPMISWGIAPAEEIDTSGFGGPALWDIFKFSITYPWYFLKLSGLKALLFIAHAKPYYSVLHNLAIVFFLLPVHVFAIRGYRLCANPFKQFVLFYFGVQTTVVALTSENWDGRFLIPILPWIFLLAGLGLVTVSRFDNIWPNQKAASERPMV